MQRFGQDGFCLIRGVLNARECARVRAAIVPFDGAGRRGLLQNPDLRRIAELPVLVDLIRGLLAGEPFPVRAIYFRKSADSNWFIGWHQDLTIAVNEKCDEPEFGPWSVKEGLVHVQPPVAVLEQMLTVRLHWMTPTNGTAPCASFPGRIDWVVSVASKFSRYVKSGPKLSAQPEKAMRC
jgi:hypothetical protein